jgi:hypothetical protein
MEEKIVISVDAERVANWLRRWGPWARGWLELIALLVLEYSLIRVARKVELLTGVGVILLILIVAVAIVSRFYKQVDLFQVEVL